MLESNKNKALDSVEKDEVEMYYQILS